MRTDKRDHTLAAELSRLGRRIDVPQADEHLVDAVMARVAAEPIPRTPGRARTALEWFRQRRRAAGAALAALLIGLALTPPVRATVADWFQFGGVEVREAPAQPSAPPPPAADAEVSLRQARELVAFPITVPAELGHPDGVEVSDDRRVASLTWANTTDGPLRLDQFDGTLAPVMRKGAPGSEYVQLGYDTPALWFDVPHEVVVLGPDGAERTETARLAGQTLIWERTGITLRLEGGLTQARAVAIAQSVLTVPR